MSASCRFCCRHCLQIRPGALRRLSAPQAMPDSKKPWINPAPRWWITQRPRPCMGAAYDHLRRAGIVPSGCRPKEGDWFARRGARSKSTRIGRVRRSIFHERHRRRTRITVSCPRCGVDAHFLILFISRRPPRCRRAEANSPTLELTSGTDRPWFDLMITQ